MSRELFLAPTTLPELTPLEFVRAAADSGCDGVGIRLYRSPRLPFHPVVGDAVRERELKAALAGVPVLDLYSFYLLADTDVRDFLPALEYGAALGAKYALVQGDDPDYARLIERFAGFCDLAAPLGLSAALEFVAGRSIATLPRALQLLREARRTNACVLVDALHLARSGHPAADLRMLDLPYAQISDGLRAGGPRRIPGEGDLALQEFMAALPANIPLSVEVLPPPPDESAASWARRVVAGTRRFLATAEPASRPSA